MYKQVHGSCICIIYFPGVEYLNMCAENFISVPWCHIVKIHSSHRGSPKLREGKHPTTTRMEKKYPHDLTFPALLNTWSFPLAREIWQPGTTNEATWSDVVGAKGVEESQMISENLITSMIQSFKVVVIHRYPPEIHLLNFSKRIISQLCPGMASQQSGSLQGL